MVTEEDIKTLDSLLKTEIILYKIYQNLVNNEITKKDVQERDINMILIHETVIKESVLLDDFINPDKAYLVNEYLEKKLYKKYNMYEADTYFNNDERSSAIKRIINFLTPLANQSKYFYDYCQYQLKQISGESINKKRFDLSQRLADRILNDNLSLLLNDLDDEIADITGPTKEELIKLRYEIIYQNPFIESNYLTVDYDKVKFKDFDTKLIFELESLKKDKNMFITIGLGYDILSNLYSTRGFETQLDKLKKYNNYDFNDPKKCSEIILLLTYIKSVMVLIDIKTLKELNIKIDKEFSDDSKKIIYSLLKNTLSMKSIETEKNKHRVISLTKNT